MSGLNDIMAADFQNAVEATLERNKSLLDTVSKLGMAEARFSRAIVKSATQCGCIDIIGKKNAKKSVMISGELCEGCREIIMSEMGEMLYYIAACAGALGVSMYDVMLKEKNMLSLLQNYCLK